MKSCKYSKDKNIDGIVHEVCSNEELKEFNKIVDKDIPCIYPRCGKFEEKEIKQNEVLK